jgi:hypothetical protein
MHHKSTYSQNTNDRGHQVQHLGISSGRHVPLVVNQHRLQQAGNEIRVRTLEVFRPPDVGLDQLEDLLFDGPQCSNLGRLRGDQT